jgi:hypothetical protein
LFPQTLRIPSFDEYGKVSRTLQTFAFPGEKRRKVQAYGMMAINALDSWRHRLRFGVGIVIF